LGTKIGLTKNPTEENTRQPLAINDTYFIRRAGTHPILNNP